MDDQESVAEDQAGPGPQRVEDENGTIAQARFLDFLSTFSTNDIRGSRGDEDSQSQKSITSMSSTGRTSLIYLQQVEFMKESERSTLHVDFSHVLSKDHLLADAILGEFYRYSPFLNKAIQQFVRKAYPDYVTEENGNDREFFCSFYNLPNVDKVRSLRTEKLGQLCSISGTVTRTSEVRPELLFGTFECLECGVLTESVEQQFKFTPPVACKNRQCKNTNAFDLIPDRSQFVDWQKIRVQENANEVPAGSMPRSVDVVLRHEIVERCKPGDKCIFTGSLIVIPDVSQLKAAGEGPGLQSSRQGPRGASKGDGVSGLKALGVREMTYRLAFLASGVHPANGRFGGTVGSSCANNVKEMSSEQLMEQLLHEHQQQTMEEETNESIQEQYTDEEINEIKIIASQPNLLSKMRKSVAPTVFGHEDIKLGILLMLFGGVHKRTDTGTKLRGDINVCIVGDPSTAKSQFLKYVCSFIPRAIYTSGKASSAAGLTATVVKDPETGEYCIEAGALMLADNGICCIDEFDKMDDMDQVAIHEAMEQQTISITKAGIQATLNARTSVLAAANPIHGRYDRSKTLKANLTLSPAIMSRFDLFFVVLDECDEVQDRIIAEHIVRVHQRRIAALLNNEDPEAVRNQNTEEATRKTFLDNDDEDTMDAEDVQMSQTQQQASQTFSQEQLQSYIRYARTIDPIIPPNIQPKLVECYRRLREGDNVGQNRTAYRITVRQLEALIRLAEAIARLHLDDCVRPRYVEWSYHLLRTSIVHVDSADVRFDDPGLEAVPGSALNRKKKKSTENASDSDSSEDSDDDDEQDQNAYKNRNQTGALSYDDYMRTANMVALYIRKREDEALAANKRTQAVLQRDVVKYYLTQRDDISSEAQLVQERRLINKVIQRLIEKDNVLLQVEVSPEDQEPIDPAEDDDDDDDDEDDEFPEEKNWLRVHPNHVVGYSK